MSKLIDSISTSENPSSQYPEVRVPTLNVMWSGMVGNSSLQLPSHKNGPKYCDVMIKME
jgi:hypothetical protein